MIYRILAKFERDYVNPLTGRHGRWRVFTCWKTRYVECYATLTYGIPDVVLSTVASKPYKKGSIISPTKELRRVLNNDRASQH